MSEVYLKHNPFLDEIICTVDGEDVTGVSGFKKCWGEQEKSFFQDWVGDFFGSLHEHANDDSYEVEFSGLAADYRDLENARDEFVKKNQGIQITLKQQKNDVKSSEDRIKQLKELFAEMQKESPYEELRSDQVKKNFDQALGEEEEIGIIATMSSGKSTLLNAILHQELLPAKNEATTAVVAKIYNNDSLKEFRVSATDREGSVICDDRVATPKLLDELNGNKEVKTLEIHGNIPNIKEYGLRVVLSDTPGPNNSADSSHKEHTYKLIGQAYKPMILYIFNATQLEINDDKLLLGDIAREIKKSGIQSKDRFIFVLNKVDMLDINKGENAKKSMERLEGYLKGLNIENPRIFAVSSYLSKVIRLKQNGLELTEDEEDFLLTRVRRFNGKEERQLDRLAPLSKEGRKKQEELLEKAKAEGDDLALADIHSGIPALEIAINEYVEKYALRSKVKVSVQSFQGFIKNQTIKTRSLEAISQSQENIKAAIETLTRIEKELKSGEEARAIQEEIRRYDFEGGVNEFLDEERSKLSELIDEFVSSDSEMDIQEAQRYLSRVSESFDHFSQSFTARVEEAVEQGFLETAKGLFEKYQNKMESFLLEKSSFDENFGGKISMGSLVDVSLDEKTLLRQFRDTKEERIKHTRGNKNKAWYKPWTWGDDDYEVYYTTKTKEIFDADAFSDGRLYPLYDEYAKRVDDIRDEVSERVDRFKEFFIKEIDKLQKIMIQKAKEQKGILQNKGELEKTLAREQKRVAWIEAFEQKLNSVLEI